MSCDDLLRSGRIRAEAVSRQEVTRALELAERDLRTARELAARERDWAFTIGYNAVLQACRAYMFAKGYRPASTESHRNTLAFMRAVLADEEARIVSYFDRMRRKRHQAVYDQAGTIT
jgi:uncharacterized protein (UPF0332 family)